MTKSFKEALAAYATTSHPAGGASDPPRLSAADRAHLKRWAEDERADEIWKTIKDAATKRGRVFPERFFIQEVLGAREIATSINHRRKYRERYREHAARMAEIAKVLRERLPNGLLLIPTGEELAKKLDEAARAYSDYVAVARNEDRGLRWTRQSKPIHVFMNLLSKDLKGITGNRLDYEVAILTEIAFDELEIDTDQVLWARRGVKRDRPIRKHSK